jgi:spermidine/putrescine transport system permease protein
LIRTYALIAVLRTHGYINQTLSAFHDGLSGVMKMVGLSGLGDFVPLALLYNNFAVIVGLVFVNLPFMILPLYSTLDRMDKSLLEASLDLGAGHFKTIFNVVVPLAGAGIASGVLITFIPALGSYLTPDLLGGPESQMIANVIEAQFKRANNWPFGAALSFLLVYLTLIAIAAQGLLEKNSEAGRK